MRQCQLLRHDRFTVRTKKRYRDPHLNGWRCHWWRWSNLEADVLVNLGPRHTQCIPMFAEKRNPLKLFEEIYFLAKELQSIDAWHHQDWAPTSMPEWIPSISRLSAQDSKTPSRYLSLSDAEMLNILGNKNCGMFFERVTKNEWSLANNMCVLC